MQPFVSCILPTKNRATRIRLAIHSYLTQTYSNCELIILDNGDDGTDKVVPSRPDVHYLKVKGDLTTGVMRNLCNHVAKGEIIAHFDSDDWCSSTRLTDQVTRLDTGVLTAYQTMWFWDERHAQGYKWGMARPYGMGNSLCYRKDWWQRHPFESVSIGEDYKFFKNVLKLEPTRLTSVDVGQHMVAVVHNDQTSKKNLMPPHYKKVDRSQIPREFLLCVSI